MKTETVEELASRKCVPCEGGVEKYTRDDARRQLDSLSGWELNYEATRIQKEYVVKDFMAGIDFFQRVAGVAEAEGHHPDLHLENYRRVRVELSTHAIGGLSQNDFILAAKIDRLPVELRSEAASRKPR